MLRLKEQGMPGFGGGPGGRRLCRASCRAASVLSTQGRQYSCRGSRHPASRAKHRPDRLRNRDRTAPAGCGLISLSHHALASSSPANRFLRKRFSKRPSCPWQGRGRVWRAASEATRWRESLRNRKPDCRSDGETTTAAEGFLVLAERTSPASDEQARTTRDAARDPRTSSMRSTPSAGERF